MSAEFDWVEALADLRGGAKHLDDYDGAADPDRARRIHAADTIRSRLFEQPDELTDARLRILQEALFDCSAAVREAMIVTFAALGSKESLQPLLRLKQNRAIDAVQSEYLQQAIDVIERRIPYENASKLKVWTRG